MATVNYQNRTCSSAISGINNYTALFTFLNNTFDWSRFRTNNRNDSVCGNNKGLTKVSPRLIYEHFNYIGPVELDRIGFFASGEIERRYGDAFAVPIPADSPYEYWDVENMEGKGLLSMKHAAVKAGIGQMGKSTLLLNSKFGNLLSIGAILTNLELPSDPYTEEICIESCRLCLDSCPVKAPDGVSVNQKSCRTYAYGSNEKGYDVVNCNKCRTICPMRYGKRDGNEK